jgi:anaerobic selenocysteine-containing dehydrogenase
LEATKKGPRAASETIVKTTCQLWCGAGCGMLVHLEDGCPVEIGGDPDRKAGA